MWSFFHAGTTSFAGISIDPYTANIHFCPFNIILFFFFFFVSNIILLIQVLWLSLSCI